MIILATDSRDVYRNLAVEEWLLEHSPRLPVLFLCVNDPCVVIGKNQNPWRECRLSLMEKEGVVLARRISGGGAVYHDAGNLNVSVIVPRTQYVEDRQYELIFQCLEKFGINASRVRKNSLAVDGLKFSGQAFCHRRDRSLHHGTLLVNSDLNRLGRYLGADIEGIETRAIASVPAEVANLSQFAPDLTVEKLSVALIETFQEFYKVPNIGKTEIPERELLPIIGKNSSQDWKLGHTPGFVFQNLEVEKGRIINLPNQPWFEDWRKEHAADI